ncbi:type II toxin-antitoxin system VapC family toxin [Candidatus Amarolinea aalborgensis]|jgi:PIN domain nuclease of toxin-antitoxin system|uniref:type II toxin-antitoxin system VapC family toxin n=1 Tax=Candidatus Amarolinea aalborgensis TaxID=2249329 RepID=UPI003BFA0A4B
MRLLLDTQIFIWWDSESEKLPARVLQLCEDEANSLVLSVASIWEMQIKAQLGKLDLNRPLQEIIHEQERANRIELLSVQAAHVFGIQQLSFHHKDPFDRLLIAQAMVENIPVLSVDPLFAQYPIQVIAS